MIIVHLVDGQEIKHANANDWGVGRAGELYIQHHKPATQPLAGLAPRPPEVKCFRTYAPGLWGYVERGSREGAIQ